jgi:hypothetical protein
MQSNAAVIEIRQEFAAHSLGDQNLENDERATAAVTTRAPRGERRAQGGFVYAASDAHK